MTKITTYQIYAIKYAQHERSAESNFMDPPDIHNGEMPIDFFVWLVRSKERDVLVDTGFNSKTAAKRGRASTQGTPNTRTHTKRKQKPRRNSNQRRRDLL